MEGDAEAGETETRDTQTRGHGERYTGSSVRLRDTFRLVFLVRNTSFFKYSITDHRPISPCYTSPSLRSQPLFSCLRVPASRLYTSHHNFFGSRPFRNLQHRQGVRDRASITRKNVRPRTSGTGP